MDYRRQNNNSFFELTGMALLFIISPFLSFILALREPLKRNNQIFIVLFFAVLGYYRMLERTGDAAFWTYRMLWMQTGGVESFIRLVKKYSYFNSGYFLFLYLFSHIKYTAVIWSLIFSLTAINFLYIYEMHVRTVTHGRTSFLGACLFFLFLGNISFISFGIKFWLAFLLFVTGYSLVTLKDKKMAGNALIITSFFFHYSLAYLIIIYYATVFLTNKNTNNKAIKILPVLLALVVLYVGFKYNNIAFLIKKLNHYSNKSMIGHMSAWIIADRVLITLASILTIAYTYVVGVKDKRNRQLRNFLLYFAIALIPLSMFLDGLDRYSRAFSFMTLLFIIRLEACKQRLPLLLKTIILVTFSWHVVVNFILRRGEVGFEIFYQSFAEFFTHGPMSIMFYD